MKPQQIFDDAAAIRQAVRGRVRRARTTLPTLTAIAVAIASSVMLTLGGCASHAGIGSVAQPIAPSSVGLAPGPVLP